MIEEFNFITENQVVTKKKPIKKNIQKKDDEVLNFEIDTMFDVPTWSPTLDDFRKSKDTKNKNSFSLDEIEKENQFDENFDDNFDDTKNPQTFQDNEQDDEEILETRKDMATLVVMLFDMAVDSSINIFTKYKVEEKISDNDKKRKQLERVCVKIMAKYEFEPNVWTELIAVLSVYGMDKFNALKLKENTKNQTNQKTTKKQTNLDLVENKVNEQQINKKINLSQGISDLL